MNILLVNLILIGLLGIFGIFLYAYGEWNLLQYKEMNLRIQTLLAKKENKVNLKAALQAINDDYLNNKKFGISDVMQIVFGYNLSSSISFPNLPVLPKHQVDAYQPVKFQFIYNWTILTL
jgi:hypothetical protein